MLQTACIVFTFRIIPLRNLSARILVTSNALFECGLELVNQFEVHSNPYVSRIRWFCAENTIECTRELQDLCCTPTRSYEAFPAPQIHLSPYSPQSLSRLVSTHPLGMHIVPLQHCPGFHTIRAGSRLRSCQGSGSPRRGISKSSRDTNTRSFAMPPERTVSYDTLAASSVRGLGKKRPNPWRNVGGRAFSMPVG